MRLIDKYRSLAETNPAPATPPSGPRRLDALGSRARGTFPGPAHALPAINCRFSAEYRLAYVAAKARHSAASGLAFEALQVFGTVGLNGRSLEVARLIDGQAKLV